MRAQYLNYSGLMRVAQSVAVLVRALWCPRAAKYPSPVTQIKVSTCSLQTAIHYNQSSLERGSSTCLVRYIERERINNVYVDQPTRINYIYCQFLGIILSKYGPIPHCRSPVYEPV